MCKKEKNTDRIQTMNTKSDNEPTQFSKLKKRMSTKERTINSGKVKLLVNIYTYIFDRAKLQIEDSVYFHWALHCFVLYSVAQAEQMVYLVRTSLAVAELLPRYRRERPGKVVKCRSTHTSSLK